MKYDIEFLTRFLKELESFSSECDSIITKANAAISDNEKRAATRVSTEKARMNGSINTSTNKRKSSVADYEKGIKGIEVQETTRRENIFAEITRCKEKLEDKVSDAEKNNLRSEITRLEANLFANQAKIDSERESAWSKYLTSAEAIERDVRETQSTSLSGVARTIRSAHSDEVIESNRIKNELERKLQEAKAKLHKAFPPEELEKAFFEIYKAEPNIDEYTCKVENPTSVRISDLLFPFSDLKLCDFAVDTINKDYFFLTKHLNDTGRKQYIKAPYCINFDKQFNYLFELNNSNREMIIDRICSMAMRLFMMLPPNKVNFTFIDPITLGETFASFTRLVDVDDRASKVINGKIWTSPADIEEKLRITTDHVANVTQRCLQGQYENIQEYNIAAGQNAEPYQVLMIMDFPASFNENSLKLLEQIIATGPKCGVYTVLVKSAEQYAKVDERRLKPLVNNIINNVSCFTAEQQTIAFQDKTYNGKRICFDVPKALTVEELDKVIPVLKSGIKNAEKIVIGFDKIIPSKEEWFKGDCSSELSIPIGVHGANNIQNLTFGIGGSHHALVAGQTGAGKSSLLHTIIMSALIKYPADQLQVFLVDFKRGVEFKIYANYSLENFKVIAIESEREFGCSVLEYLDKEQSRRADKFKRLNVDNVEDYREKSGETLPRIMLIIDEFHVLFSKDTTDNNSKASATYLEQIIRQGRAFGIHIILASQTMSNIGGINYGVWGQVGVRIALKCPKSDAKFVLGNDNDGVDLLSADNPGQAVYNSDSGNVIANTVFRVAYIDQDEQDTYLKYIAENEPKFGYPETRVMLSNVEDNIYNPLQKFARGEKVSFAENAILVGEPLKLVNNMRMTFKAKHGSNMLVIGNDEQRARNFFTFAALSLTLHKLYANDYKTPNKKSIYFFDYAPLEDFYEKDILLELAKMLPDYIKYIPFDETDEAMEELYQDFTRREKGEAPKEDTYMFVYGLQRARNLRSSDVYKKNNRFEDFDEFGETVREQLSVKPYDMFLNLLQRGATVGINALIWEDNFKLFMNSYADMLPNFDMRVAFTMPDDDSINFIEEVDGSKIGENGAIYNYNGNQKFRPYKKPDLDWLTKICKRINGFN